MGGWLGGYGGAVAMMVNVSLIGCWGWVFVHIT